MPGVKEWIKNAAAGLSGGTFGGIAEIIGKFVADPTEKAKALKELEEAKLKHDEEMARISVQADEVAAKELETVNSTMREEAKSEHWMVWSWRPLVGYTFSAVLVNNYILLPYFKSKGMEVIQIPGEVWSALLVILGAASAGRSFEKTLKK
jgi:hypothetical protein